MVDSHTTTAPCSKPWSRDHYVVTALQYVNQVK